MSSVTPAEGRRGEADLCDAATSASAPSGLTVPEAVATLKRAVKDRAYRATPLGLEVARYIRWKRNEWGATPTTIRDYEAIWAKAALYFADLQDPIRDLEPPVGTERLRECIDFYWSDAAGRTRKKVRSVLIDGFEYFARERGMVGNPARALASPKARDVEIETFPPSVVDAIITAQTYPADAIGCALILKYGLRKGGLQSVRRKSFDFERRLLTVFTKGERIYPVPIIEPWIWRRLGELEVAGWQDEHWLLYKQDTRNRKVALDEADEVLDLGGGRRQGYAKVTTRKHTEQPTEKMAHLWWYRCLERAGVVAPGTTSGMNMHRGRHTAATELQRSEHDLKLTQLLLGHKDIRSTARYAQMDTTDLAAALRRKQGEE